MSYHPYSRRLPATKPRLNHNSRLNFSLARDQLPPVIIPNIAQWKKGQQSYPRIPLERVRNRLGPTKSSAPEACPGVELSERWVFSPFSPKEIGPSLTATYSSDPRQPAVASILTYTSIVHTIDASVFKKVCITTEIDSARPPPAIATHKRLRTPFPPRIESPEVLDAVAQHTHTKKRTSDVTCGLVPFINAGRYELRPFAEWLSGHLFYVLTTSNNVHSIPISSWVQRSVIDKLLDILAYYHPEPAIIFLALWYLSRLIPRGLVNYCDFHGEESTEVMARIFLLGLTLANKWFDDFVTKNKYWTKFCSLSITSINRIEVAALSMLDYNLHISNDEWETWLLSLVGSTAVFTSAKEFQWTSSAILRDLLSEIVQSCTPRACANPTRKSSPFLRLASGAFCCQVIKICPSSRTFTSSTKPLRP